MSVHRRDRCTRTLPFFIFLSCTPFLFSVLHCLFCTSFVLVCLSTDVTGALVLLFLLFHHICFVSAGHFTKAPSFLHFLCVSNCTCVSVHRRDRCTRTFPYFYFVSRLILVPCESCILGHKFVVYGCLSTDVTGALFLPTSQRTCESVHRRDRFTRTLSSSRFCSHLQRSASFFCFLLLFLHSCVRP